MVKTFLLVLVLLTPVLRGYTAYRYWDFTGAPSNSEYCKDLVTNTEYCSANGCLTDSGIVLRSMDYVDFGLTSSLPFPITILCFWILPPQLSQPFVIYDATTTSRELFTLNTSMIFEREQGGIITQYTTSGISILEYEWIALGITIDFSSITYFWKKQGNSQVHIELPVVSKNPLLTGYLRLGHPDSSFYGERILLNQVYITSPLTEAEFSTIISSSNYENLISPFLKEKNYIEYILSNAENQHVPDTGDTTTRHGMLGMNTSEDVFDPVFLGDQGMLLNATNFIMTVDSYSLTLTKGVSLWANIPCDTEQTFLLYSLTPNTSEYTNVSFASSIVTFQTNIYSSTISSTLAPISSICDKWSFFYIGILSQTSTSCYISCEVNSYRSGPSLLSHDTWSATKNQIFFGYPAVGKIRSFRISADPNLLSDELCYYAAKTVDNSRYTYCEVDQYLALDGSCTTCSAGSYPDFWTQICAPCPTNCTLCLNATYCTGCYTDNFFHILDTGQLCINPCPDKHFIISESNSCVPCVKNCLQCSDETSCALCDTGYYFFGPSPSCLNPCPSFYYKNDSSITCNQCIDHCQSCTTETNCNECALGYYSNELLPGINSCELCPEKCYYCISENTCEECNSTFYLFTAELPHSCLIECPEYYYGTVNYICDNCIDHCRNCSSATNCSLCEDGYYLDFLSKEIQQCINPCRDGYFNDNNNVCKSCVPNCKVCTNETQCIECFDPYFRKRVAGDIKDTCELDCGKKFYSVSNIRICYDCDFRCLTCTSSSNKNCPDCDFTKKGVAKVNSTTCSCSSGYVANFTSNQCETCSDSLCESCSLLNLDECYSCSTSNSKIIYDSSTKSCVCMAGYYRKGDSCLPCNSLCSECTGPSSTQCKAKKCGVKAYPLDSLPTTCLYMCKSTQGDLFLDLDKGVCRICLSPCKACYASNINSCSTCIEGYILMDSTCISGCPTKYYNASNICLQCDERCLDCVDRTNYCVGGCESPYLYKDHQCLTSCGAGFTGISGFCEPCDSGCSECYTESGSLKKICTKCEQGLYLYKGECSSVCPVGRYCDVVTGNCELCTEACTTCANGTYKDCLTCNSALGYIKIAETTCSFPACLDGYFFNRVLIACTICPTGCATCDNSSFCNSCEKGYTLTNRKCANNCNKVGFERDSATYQCKEICGDGRNMGELECDDGNKIDGDGCDSSCKVEEYFECSGGDSTHSDTCVERKKPYLYSIKYYSNRSVSITFNEVISISGQLGDLFSITLENAQDPGVSWSYQNVNLKYTRRLIFDLYFNHSLSGSEELVFKVKDLSKMVDLNGNHFRDSEFRVKAAKYSYISENEKSTAENSGKASLYAMLPSLALSVGLSLVFNTPIEGMWASISVIQMISYLTLIKLSYPSNLMLFFDCIETVHNFNKWLPNPFSYIISENALNMQPYTEQFNSRGFENRHMIFLCGSDLFLLFFTTLVIYSLIPIAHLLNIFNTVLDKLRWGSVVRSFIQAYLKICLSIFVNVGVLSFNNWQSCLSSMITIIVGSIMICIPAFISDFLYQNYEKAKYNSLFRKRHASYLSGFRIKSNILNLMYYPIFLFRRVVFSATIVILCNYPFLQLSFSFLGSVAILFYLFYWKPFSNKYSFYSAVNAEILFAIINLSLFGFTENKLSSKGSTNLGWIIICLIICSLGISWIFMLIQQVRTWLWNRKSKTEGKQKTIDAPTVSEQPLEEKNEDSKNQLESIKKGMKRQQKMPNSVRPGAFQNGSLITNQRDFFSSRNSNLVSSKTRGLRLRVKRVIKDKERKQS